ncbi:ESX secretion-associated protein EspG [Nocardia sp. alder85J]|uniref:ESX secretion-associated protein EspG n=1 Tax=Nocardia sp. alder85J TaxID=2862949 RepID=UPI001CD61A97|nr:ESX secretion-associated protein EspG [Nocardia sp. alder85J]MCX4097451.1 ESX secretion-associated protein EspG [Nocardia sp. alder85J]
MSWSFTPDEFAHLWRETDLDRHPFPLRILESPRTEAEAAALRREIEVRLPLRADPDLSACLRILAQPQTRVAMIGGRHAPGTEIRVLGAAVYDHAVLAVQEPGSSPDYGGRVQLSIGHTGKLGARIANLLPDTPPGREPARAAITGTVRDDEAVHTAGPPVRRIRKLLLQPHTAEGHLRIETHLDLDSPPTPVHYAWIDVADDGRYLIRAGDEVHITAASTQQIAAHLQKRILR